MLQSLVTTTKSLPVLAQELRTGSLALESYLDQLEARFREVEPQVKAFVPELNQIERLHNDARELLERYPDPSTRPALFGVPVGVKDIFHVSGFLTRAGSSLPPEILTDKQASSIGLLKNAGALILGKTITTEFAYFGPGPTRNPHNLNHTPGGSSSGSAAAVASGLCPLAAGTQTIGSIVRPASFCGIVGFKPSYDRVSRQGVIPLSQSLDHVGFFTSDTTGARMVAPFLCRNWFPRNLDRPPVLAIAEGPYLTNATDENLDHFEKICRRLEEAGFEIKRLEMMNDFNEIVERHYLIAAAEAALAHTYWFAAYKERYHEKTADLIERGQQVPIGKLVTANNERLNLRREIGEVMELNGVDLWIAPSSPGPAPEGLDNTGNPIMNLPWTQAGLPSINIPSGNSTSNLPLGIQLVGNWYWDEQLLDWSIILEPIIRGVA